MRIFSHPPAGLRRFCLYSFVALLLLAGCGKRLSGEAQKSDPANPHFVTITWAASKSPVAGYNVYRASPPGSPAIKLTIALVTATQYTDRAVEAGRTYSYYVTSVDNKGNESKPSGDITATVPTTVTPPAKQ